MFSSYRMDVLTQMLTALPTCVCVCVGGSKAVPYLVGRTEADVLIANSSRYGVIKS